MKKFIGIILILVFLNFLVPVKGAESTYTSDSSNWNMNRNVTALNRISCFKNKVYIAIGYYGTIRTSSDCMNWKVIDSIPTDSNLLDITCTDSQIIVVGENGLILRSTDGIDWKVIEPITTDKITKIIYGNNTFLAFTNNQEILTSVNGLDWKKNKTRYVVKDAVFNGKLFILSGEGGEISSSSDGLNWKTQILKDRTEFKIIWNGKIFVAFGIKGAPGCTSELYTATSKDGYNWAVKPVNMGYVIKKYSNDFECYSPNIIWNGKAFVVTALEAYGASPFYVNTFISNDGVHWKRYSFEPEDTDRYYSMNTVWAGNRYISVCSQQYVQTIYTSKDGVKWSTSISRHNGKAKDIIYNRGTSIIVGAEGDIATSNDGLTWNISNNNHKVLYYKDNKFISIDNEITYVNKKDVYKKYLYTSKDGLIWKKENEIKEDIDLGNLVWSGKEYISLNNYCIYTSNNLLTWKKDDISSLKKLGHIKSFTTDGNWYVLFGNKGTAISKDKKKWTIRTNSSYYTPHIVIGKNCMVGYNYGNKQISVSVDGVKWKDIEFTNFKCSISEVVYSGNQFICIGSDCILYSKDGLNWTKAQTPDKFNGIIKKLVSSGSSYAAIGEKALLYSGDGSVWTETYSFNSDLPSLDLGWTGGEYIAVKNDFGIATSKDGTSWQKEKSGYIFTEVFGKNIITEVFCNNKITIVYSYTDPLLYRILK